MTFLKLLLNGGLLFMATMALSSNKNPKNYSLFEWNISLHYHLPDNVVPIHYNIILRPFTRAYTYIIEGGSDAKMIDFIQKNETEPREAEDRGETDVYYQIFFYGQLSVMINILSSTKRLILHSLNLHIDEDKTTLISRNGGHFAPSKHLYDNDILILNFKHELSPGKYTLHMRFIGIIPNNTVDGFFVILYKTLFHKTWIVATRFHPTNARRVFPCWDEPKFKATFSISVKHSSLFFISSNVPKIEKEQVLIEPATFWTYFNNTPKISTYQVAVILINATVFFEKQSNQVKQKWLCDTFKYSKSFKEKYLQFAPEVSIEVMRFLRNEWKNYVTFLKLDHIIIPSFQTKFAFLNNGMDSFGINVYRDEDIIYTQSQSVSRKMEVTHLIAFKLARQLFANLVSPSWWSYMWLNEALAHFFGAYISDKIYREQNMDLFVVQCQQESFRLEPIMVSLAVEVHNPSEIEDLFSSMSYAVTLRYRAPFIIRMLQHMITDENFQTGIRRYLDKYLYSSANPDDLWDIMQTIIDEANHFTHKNLQLKKMINFWINKINFPVVNVINSDGKIIIGIDNTKMSREDEWLIPVTYTMQRPINFNDTLPLKWIELKTMFSLFEDEGWIIVNLQQAGYYRVNYYSENWWKIAKFLNSDQYKNIHVLNRAQIIDDAYYFVMEGKLEFTIFLELIKYLSRETDYVAWYPMFKILEDTSRAFPVSVIQRLFSIVKIHMRNALNELFRNIRYEDGYDKNDLTKCLRQEALKWARVLGDSEYMKRAIMQLQKTLTNLEYRSKILLNCKTWLHYRGLLKKDMDPDIIVEYVKLMIPHVYTVSKKPNEKNFWENERIDIDIILYIVTKYAKNTKLLKYFLENFHIISPKNLDIKGQIAVLIIIINHVYSEEHLKIISQKLLELFPYQKQLTSMFRKKINFRALTYVNIFIDYFDNIIK